MPVISVSPKRSQPKYAFNMAEKGDQARVQARRSSVTQMMSQLAPIEESLKAQPHVNVELAEHTPPDELIVKVLCGRNMTHGYLDYVDTPDPYITLRLPNAAIPFQKTNYIQDNINPVWNEEFTFFIDFHEEPEHILEITLMDKNYIMDETVCTVTFEVHKELKFGETSIKKTFTMCNTPGCEIDIEFTLRKNGDEADLRYSADLCDKEKEFLRKRKTLILKKMKEVFGDDGPCREREVPNVSIIGSGGGFRAMVGLAGAMKALTDAGLLDMVQYIGGLSGSSWYLSTLYSEPDFPNGLKPNDKVWLDSLKERINQSALWLMSPSNVYKHYGHLKAKYDCGQPVTFTDCFGLMVGETLLGDRMDSCTLSDQRNIVEDGSIPLPLYAALHVKEDVSAMRFADHVEFNPFEVGMEKYGVFMDSKLFGSRFYSGKVVEQFPESKLHYLQGVLGSAFTILFNRLVDTDQKDEGTIIEDQLRGEMEEHMKHEFSEAEYADDTIPRVKVDPVSSLETNDHANGTSNGQAETNGHANGTSNGQADGADENGASEKKPAADGTDGKNEQESSWFKYFGNFFDTSELMGNRKGRAARVYSFLKKIKFKTEAVVEGVVETGVRQLNKLFLVDAGLSFNSPYPMVLRSDRKVDLILSFDFSARESDAFPPFRELLLAEMWARRHNKPFPPIDANVYEKKGMQEMYIFEDPEDPKCPMVLHFPLVKKTFKDFKAPGVPRETEEEKEAGNIDLFSKDSCYNTFNFNYREEDFDRLATLTEFNTNLKIEDIKEAIKRRIALKRGQKSPMKMIDERDVIE